MKLKTFEFFVTLGAGLVAAQSAYGQSTSLLAAGAKVAEAGEVMDFAGKHPLMAMMGAGVLGGGAFAADEYHVRQAAISDVGVALSNYGTPSGSSAVDTLSSLVHQHAVLAPAAVDQAFAKATAANPGSDTIARKILIQIGLGVQAYERDRDSLLNPSSITRLGD